MASCFSFAGFPGSTRPSESWPAAPTRFGRRAFIVEQIRHAILANDLAPGQRLFTSELAELFGVTHETVRFALTDLIHEGLVESRGDRGARVRAVTLDEALHHLEVCALIEGLCVGRAAEKITDAEIAELRALAKQFERRARDGDLDGLAADADHIAATYLRIADQPIAAAVLERSRSCIARYQSRLGFWLSRPQPLAPFWLERAEAICRRDPEAARDSVRRHADEVRGVMKQAGSGPSASRNGQTKSKAARAASDLVSGWDDAG
jgi:DNA-binding GntR family transcriptional regulator